MHFKTVLAHLKSKIFSVGQPLFHIETCWTHIFVLDPHLISQKNDELSLVETIKNVIKEVNSEKGYLCSIIRKVVRKELQNHEKKHNLIG